MLQHEQTDLPAAAPTVPLPIWNAADARVTPDELNTALKALEDRQNSTVAIGSVVDELRLNATPEQIWEQVQQQRTQQAQAAQTPPAQSFATPKILPRRRIWWAMITAIGFLFGGVVMLNSSTHTSAGVKISGQTLTMSGDGVTGPNIHRAMSLTTQAGAVLVSGDDGKLAYTLHHECVVVEGNNGDITLRGDCKDLCVEGDGNTVRIIGSVEGGSVEGAHNVIWVQGKHGIIKMDIANDHNQLQEALQ